MQSDRYVIRSYTTTAAVEEEEKCDLTKCIYVDHVGLRPNRLHNDEQRLQWQILAAQDVACDQLFLGLFKLFGF